MTYQARETALGTRLISTNSEVASHCSVFALSDCTNPDLLVSQTRRRMLATISEAVARALFHTDDDRDEARGDDCLRLFQSSEFLAVSQISSYFSRLNAAAHQQDMDELDIQASEEETNFTGARDVATTASQIQHPITYDQFNLCSMAKGDTLKLLKLPMLQRVCEGLGLGAPYMKLLKDITQNCSCQQ